MKLNRLLWALVFLSFVLVSPAQADLLYTYSVSSGPYPGLNGFSWTVSTSSFLTNNETFTSFVSATNPGNCAIQYAFIAPQWFLEDHTYVSTTWDTGGGCETGPSVSGIGEYFANVNGPGTYTGLGGGHLTISQTPEPAALLLLGTGMIAGIAVRKKR